MKMEPCYTPMSYLKLFISRQYNSNRFFIAGALTFILLGAAYLHTNLSFLVLLGAAGLWFLFQNYKEPKFAFNLWRLSLLYFGTVWSWLLFMNPDGWSPLNGIKAKALVVFVWIVVVFISSIPLYYVAKLWKYINSTLKLGLFNSLIIFISLWILQELSRSYLFSMVMLGDGSQIAPHWNFGVLGIPLVSLGFASELSSTLGMYGMSVFVLLIGVLISLIKQKNPKFYKLAIFISLLVVVGKVISYTYDNNLDKVISVSAINTSDSVIDFRMHQNVNKSDLIVLPEYSEIFSSNMSDQENEKQAYIEQATNANSLLITSKEFYGSNTAASNKLIIYKNSGAVYSEQDKTFIIPGGEYIPYWAEVPFKTIFKDGLAEYNLTRKVLAGTTPEIPTQTEFGVIGAYACSGVISPEVYRELSKQGAEILTNSASLTIFNGSEIYHQQTEGFTKFHAIANRKPFVQATKMGKSYIIDSNGRVLQKSETAEDKHLFHVVKISDSKTIYTQYGELTIYLAFAIVGYYLVRIYLRTNNQHK